jgi:hypothetical protein
MITSCWNLMEGVFTMNRLTTTNLHILASALFALSSTAAAAVDVMSPLEELKACARTEDSSARIACYEELGKRVLGEEPSVAEASQIVESSSVAAAVVAAAPVEEGVPATPVAEVRTERLPDEIGGGGFEEKKEGKAGLARGHVTSCRQASDGRWFFTFDSGQIWKQSSAGHYRFKDCEFDVTITKDMFSYKMAIDGGRKLRVRRQK